MEKKTAIVTGASRGIGLATARMLAGEGYIVYGFSRSEGGLKTPDRPSDEVTGRIADAQRRPYGRVPDIPVLHPGG